MDRSTALWVLVVFFGCSIVFATLRRVTEGEPTAVVVGAQAAGLVAVILVVSVLAKKLQ